MGESIFSQKNCPSIRQNPESFLTNSHIYYIINKLIKNYAVIRTASECRYRKEYKLMKAKIEELKAGFMPRLAAATDAEALEELRVMYLGKKGYVAELMKGLRDVEDKKAAGQLINTFKGEVESAISEAEEASVIPCSLHSS